MSERYEHLPIERKWQKIWDDTHCFEAKDDFTKPKYYALIEFPFPSGAGLHVGHPRSNTALDIISRKRRMEGYNVLFPIGYDSFGLPTENYAIKTGEHPAKVTERNMRVFHNQLKMLGFSFDYSREIYTSDPAYYRWTQWIFLKLFEKGLAYKAELPINFCPSCKVGLANEEVVDGNCERCGSPVVRKVRSQWMLRITEYADRLKTAAEKNELPDLFESSDIPDDLLKNAASVDVVLDSEQANNCLFIGKNKSMLSSSKKVPLGIEIPLACVITNGATSVKYDKESFSAISDFVTDIIAVADDAEKLTEYNFGTSVYASENEFLDNEENKCAVMLATTMDINRIKSTITNYTKSFVYYDSDKIRCDYVYEWSLGNKSEAQVKAAERLLSWMLGNVYQSTLMISKCNDGQIPLNETCFKEKIKSKNLAYIGDIYTKFEFTGEETH